MEVIGFIGFVLSGVSMILLGIYKTAKAVSKFKKK